MKTVTKLLMGTAVLAASAGAAQAANLSIPDPSTDNSNLLFFVTDVTNNQTYTVELTQTLNGTGGYFTTADAKSVTASTATEAALQTINGDAGFSYNFTGDTALSSFLATQTHAGTADTFSWGIIAGAFTGASQTGRKPQGNVLMVGTASASPIGSISESAISGSAPTSYETDVGNINGNAADAFNGTTNGIIGTGGSAGGTNLNLYNAGLAMDSVNIGTTAYTLYGETTTGSASGQALSYVLGTASFNGTMLSFTGNGSAVPVPAAAWLLGSGLLGLLGIGRRRDGAATAV